MTAIAARFWDRLTVAPLVGMFFVDRTADEEARTSAAARAVAVRVVGLGIAAAIAAGVVQSVVYLFSAAFLGNTWVFNVDMDAGVFTWASSTATALAALPLCVLGYLRGTSRRLPIALGAVIFYLSLDDQIGIHERIGKWLKNTELHLTTKAFNGILWQIVYFPILLFPFLAFLWLAGHMCTRSERRAVGIGLGMLILALFAEAIHGPIGATTPAVGGLRYWTEVTIEEALELSGWIVLAGVTVSMLLRSVIDRAGRAATPAPGGNVLA